MKIIIITFSGVLFLFVGFASAEDRALLVGINDYHDQRIQDLMGCEDDVAAIRQMLIEVAGFKPEQIRTLLSSQATAQAIRDSFESWLIDGTGPGDRVVFFFSGHGSQIPDLDGDEEDGMDEILCAADYNPQTQENCIVDDEIGVWLERLKGRNVTLIVDSCHSGSISKNIDGTLWGVETIETRNSWSKFIPPPARKDIFYAPDDSRPAPVGRTRQGGNVLGTASGKSGGIVDETGANYVLFAACADYQKAEEIRVRVGQTYKRRGAFTWVLAKGLAGAADEAGDGRITHSELHRYVDRALRNLDLDLSQTPELRTRRELMNQPIFGQTFSLAGLGRVIDVRGDRVTINRGAQHGVHARDVFLVKPEKDVKSDPVARIRIDDPEQFLAVATIVRDPDNVKADYYVRRDVIHIEHGPLAVFVCRDNAEQDRLYRLLAGELGKTKNVVFTDAPEQADRFVVLQKDGEQFTTIISSRYGTVRSKVTHGSMIEAAASVVGRLRGEQILSQLAAMDNPASDIRIDISVDGGRDTFVVRKDPARREQIRFRVSVSRDSYLTLLSIDSLGEVRLLLPNKWQKDHALKAGRVYTIPSRDMDGFEICPPAGRDVIKAFATDRPLALKEVNTKSLDLQGYVHLTDGEGAVAAIVKGLSAKAIAVPGARRDDPLQADEIFELPAAGWGAAQIMVHTVEE